MVSEESIRGKSIFSFKVILPLICVVFYFQSAICFAMGKTSSANHEPNSARPKAPFKVLFSNDFTNMISCVSPYHSKGQDWTPQMLEATVDETANTGVEVHMLQPCSTWVPWWKSKVYSMQEHYKWWKEKYGVDIPKMGVQEYILKGGDPFEVFINRCRKDKLVAFISVRLNDGHHLEYADIPGNTQGAHTICKFYAEHPEYCIGYDANDKNWKDKGLKDWDFKVQNWAIPQVRDYKFSLIKEICENYDIDGLELDFMRHTSFFNLKTTTVEQREKIMTQFISDVRDLLNKTARKGKYRWLCVRVPAYLSIHSKLGINLPQMVKAGVDMVNASAFFFTEQQTDIGKIAKLVPGTPVYLEMCHATTTGKKMTKGYDVFTYRRTTDEQYYTAAQSAYSQGAAGVSAFNFVYYREHGEGEGRGPFCEPPFHVFKKLGDPKWLAKYQNQDYFLTKGYGSKADPNISMPRKFKAVDKQVFHLYMACPLGGWKNNGRFRIQSEEPMENTKWAVRFNGTALTQTSDVSEPYPNPYPSMLGNAQTLKAWIVPKEIIKNGINDIEVSMLEGKPASISYLDIGFGKNEKK